jgi:hypoxanthine phosphoribosyltransferase
MNDNKTLPPEFERVLYTEEQVEQRIREVAAEISQKYRGRDLKLIGVLKGSVFFLTALTRAITIPVKIDFLSISSFSSKTLSTRPSRVLPATRFRMITGSCFWP